MGVAGIVLLGLSATDVSLFAILFLLGNLCFAAMGELLSSVGGRIPSNVMMLSSLVRFPLIFISGIFIPLRAMTGLGLIASRFSPLSYLVDGMGGAMGQGLVFSWGADVLIPLAFSALFVFASGGILRGWRVMRAFEHRSL